MVGQEWVSSNYVHVLTIHFSVPTYPTARLVCIPETESRHNTDLIMTKPLLTNIFIHRIQQLVQLNISKMDTVGTKGFDFYSEVSLA